MLWRVIEPEVVPSSGELSVSCTTKLCHTTQCRAENGVHPRGIALVARTIGQELARIVHGSLPDTGLGYAKVPVA